MPFSAASVAVALFRTELTAAGLKMAESKRAVPLLATRDLVLFPGMLAPIFVERDKGIRALEQTQQTGGMLVMAAQRSAATDEPEPDDIYPGGHSGQGGAVLPLVRRHPEGPHRGP